MFWYSTFSRRVNGVSPESTVILFRPVGARHVKLRESFEFNDGLLWGGVKFRVIKLWKMDPEQAFRLGRDSALPWVIFMRKSVATLKRVFARIRELAKTNKAAASNIAANVAWFSGLRYDWSEPEREVLTSTCASKKK